MHECTLLNARSIYSIELFYFYYLFFHRRPTHKLCFRSCNLWMALNLRVKILVWTRIQMRISSSTRWCSNQLRYTDESLGQGKTFLLLDPQYPLVPSTVSGFMLTTHRDKSSMNVLHLRNAIQKDKS